MPALSNKFSPRYSSCQTSSCHAFPANVSNPCKWIFPNCLFVIIYALSSSREVPKHEKKEPHVTPALHSPARRIPRRRSLEKEPKLRRNGQRSCLPICSASCSQPVMQVVGVRGSLSDHLSNVPDEEFGGEIGDSQTPLRHKRVSCQPRQPSLILPRVLRTGLPRAR